MIEYLILNEILDHDDSTSNGGWQPMVHHLVATDSVTSAFFTDQLIMKSTGSDDGTSIGMLVADLGSSSRATAKIRVRYLEITAHYGLKRCRNCSLTEGCQTATVDGRCVMVEGQIFAQIKETIYQTGAKTFGQAVIDELVRVANEQRPLRLE